MFNNLSFCS